MRITIDISTCPNDTFMFEALLTGRVDTEGLAFEARLADIEQLNRRLLDGRAEISKMSYALYPLIADRYRLLTAGSALGYGNGPLLVSRREMGIEELADALIAVPGKHTTANLLLDTAFPQAVRRREYLFSDILGAVQRGEADAGVLIHETRFTYAERGLRLVADLGREWERLTGLPIPLGGIVASRRLDGETVRKADRALRRSIRYALAHPGDALPFVRSHARELDDEVIRRHIALFVNDFSVNLGEAGKKAVAALLAGSGFVPANDTFV